MSTYFSFDLEHVHALTKSGCARDRVKAAKAIQILLKKGQLFGAKTPEHYTQGRAMASRNRRLPSPDINFAVSVVPIDRHGNQPAHDKNSNEEIAQSTKILIERVDKLPIPTIGAKFIIKQAKSFDAPNHQRYDHRYRRDGYVIV